MSLRRLAPRLQARLARALDPEKFIDRFRAVEIVGDQLSPLIDEIAYERRRAARNAQLALFLFGLNATSFEAALLALLPT